MAVRHLVYRSPFPPGTAPLGLLRSVQNGCLWVPAPEDVGLGDTLCMQILASNGSLLLAALGPVVRIRVDEDAAVEAATRQACMAIGDADIVGPAAHALRQQLSAGAMHAA